ncbi:MAG: uracil-DNA glycosylase [Firmicutes bacterium]|nr:uracil-DNA glycosylase [Bacillota bacterium]MDD4693687.1 uracil-DNA glycosylase [Bacillota bacterium]
MLSIEDISKVAVGCERCSLRQNSKQVVFGSGDSKARLMVVLEAPDSKAAESGEPIFGEAGTLLHNIFAASHIKREDVYITNIVKCNPPRDRTPKKEEIVACRSWLDLEIAAIRPDYIVLFGLTPTRAILSKSDSIKELRGKWHSFGEIKVLCTYEPKTLLKTPKYKKMVWDDFKLLMKDMEGLDL